MSVCPRCGKEADGAKFCPECGEAMGVAMPESVHDPANEPADPENASVQQDEPKKKKTGKIVGVIVAVLLVVCVIGLCAIGSSGTDDSPSSTATTTKAEKAEPSVDKSSLERKLSEADSIDGSLYTDDSYAVLREAIVAGKAVVESEYATQNDVHSAVYAITEAINELEEAPFDPADYESIAYEDIARNPDSHIGRQVTFTGRVLQVIEGSTQVNLRVATDGRYDDVVFAAYENDMLDFRVLEDDEIRLYGVYVGIHTYTSTMGAEISIPAVYCDQVELQ